MTHRAEGPISKFAGDVIDVDVRTGDWPAGCAETARGAAEEALAGEHDGSSRELSVVLADDTFVQDLNRRYRGQDKPTNVLSFPADAPLLGDVVLALETLRREAESFRRPVPHHLSHLVVHGTLHLLGYDHESPADRRRMESREKAVLSRLGIPDPYVSYDEPN